jgi:hypothetical protein
MGEGTPDVTGTATSPWARPDRGAPDAPAPGEPAPLQLFATGSSLLVERASAPADATAFAELLREGGRHVRDGLDYHARPGHRPGGVTATGSRRGGDTDIVRPVLLDPLVAGRIACTGEVFRRPIEHLRVLPSDATEKFLAWEVLVIAPHERPVPATLHLLASPSMVVTVLELVPRRRLRFGRDRFVRHAVAGIDELADRLRAAA